MEEEEQRQDKSLDEDDPKKTPRKQISPPLPSPNITTSSSCQKKRNCCSRACSKISSLINWVFKDFTLKHLIWIKLIFFFQSASMTVLYPYLNLHMKSLGISVVEAAIINAIVPVLFIFTPPLANFLHDRLGSFRVLLAVLTALGGCVSLLLLIIPVGRDVQPFPKYLEWGLSCGKADNHARFQKLMIQGFRKDRCDSNLPADEDLFLLNNITFTPGPCGYLCPTRANLRVKPRFNEYKVIWPNRGGGFGISEIVDIVNLENSPEARIYHEPEIIDNNIFFPMNWTFHLSCDRIRPNDCLFNPNPRLLDQNKKSFPSSELKYHIQLKPQKKLFPTQGPTYEIASIWPPTSRRPVTSAVNCGAKEVMAQVVTTVETNTLPASFKSAPPPPTLVDTRFSGCGLHCLVKIPRTQLCSNTQKNDVRDPNLTFWSYLFVRTTLGVLTAASLMMFEGAVMSTIQELGGDYGIQRFVGNFGAIIFAPLGGYLLDISNDDNVVGVGGKRDYKSAVFVYLILKILASLMLLFIDLDFKPPGEKILKGICRVLRNAEVMMFLLMMLFAGTFWGYIESFLFWFLDDLGASKFLMGLTIAVGMITSLPFLVFSGPITELIGHATVIIIGMWAYFIRLVGYSFLDNPLFVYPYEALEGFTMALMMTSSVTYVAKIGTAETIPSIMGIMGALFFGIGKGSGALVGGILMNYLGTRTTFRCFAGNALICSMIYIIFQIAYVRPKKKSCRKSLPTNNNNNNNDHGEIPRTDNTSNDGQLKSSDYESPDVSRMEGEVNETFEDNEKTPNSASTVIIGGIVNGMNLNNPSSLSGPRSLTEGTRV
uniref:Putative LOC101737216 [Bombyx mori] n=1 Tax=Lepeophtheirus salmonis TaxID=72036 RepID=A0A0K2UEI0_LEPSM